MNTDFFSSEGLMKTLAEMGIEAVCSNTGFFSNGKLKEAALLPQELVEKIEVRVEAQKVVEKMNIGDELSEAESKGESDHAKDILSS